VSGGESKSLGGDAMILGALRIRRIMPVAAACAPFLAPGVIGEPMQFRYSVNRITDNVCGPVGSMDIQRHGH